MTPRPTTPRPTRRAARVVAAGWLTAVVWVVLASGVPAYADDNSNTSFTVTVPTASPTPAPSTTRSTTPGPGNQTRSNNQGRPAGGPGQQPGSPEDDSTPAPTEPAIRPTPGTGDPAAVDKDVVEPGGSLTVTATGFDPGEQVQVLLYSDPFLVGNFSSDEAGDISVTFTVPHDLRPGTHTVQLTGWASGHVAVATFLLASGPLAPSGPSGGVPPWAWWVGGALVLAGLGYGGWRLVQVMRAPTPALGEVGAA